ncbi:MAG: hypothetical protein PVH29_06295 [Candidatus Zixiibacteriota bacterium]|jgi:hypothetical protein
MKKGPEGYRPATLIAGVAVSVTGAVAAAATFGGLAWVAGTLAGAVAVGSDFVFIILFASAWFGAPRTSENRRLASGVLALVAKVLVPPGAIAALVILGDVPLYPLAFGALFVATAVPVYGAVFFLVRARLARATR